MKKMLTLLLVTTLIISGCLQVNFASNSTDNNKLELEQQIYLSRNISGTYEISNKKNADVKANMTKDFGIYLTESGNLVSYTGTDTYLEVEKFEVSLYDKVAVENLLNNTGMTGEIRNSMLQMCDQVIQTKNSKASVALILPKSNGEMSSRSTYNNYYTYNGWNMLDTQIMYYSIDTPTQKIEEGSDTKQTADLVKFFSFTALGFAPTPVALVSTGVSILDYLITAAQQSVITGSTSDFLEASFTYDVSTKWTYIDKGIGWELGCISQNVYLISSHTKQYYYYNSTGHPYYTNTVYNKLYTSPNYLVPAPKAYINYLNPWDERMRITLNGFTFTP